MWILPTAASTHALACHFALATVAALTALGAQTSPQLAINISGERSAGFTREEIAEVIWQMALYGEFPAAINALNVALDVFSEEDALGQ